MAKAADPVTQYATAVVEGRIVAGRLVRLACQRHLTDLATAAARSLVWNLAEALRVIDFFPKILRLPERAAATEEDDDAAAAAVDHPPFVLSPFQQFIAGSLFGWYKANGRRRFRVGYVETGKGSGKTPFGVGLMLYRCVADGELRAQVFFAATKLEQAKIPFADAESMVEASPSLRKRFLPTVNNLAMPSTGSFIRAISSEKRGLDGKRVSACLLEELHEHSTGNVVQKMRAGVKGRRNALILEITNSGFDRNSVCWHHHELSRQVLEGVVLDDSWFAFIAQLDPCEQCRTAGKLFPVDSCPKCDDWRVEGPHWMKANPNLGISLPWQYLRDEVRIAIAAPSEQGMVKRLNFCIWTDQVTVWIPVDRWQECRDRSVEPTAPATREALLARLKGRACFVGGDLSEKIDLASLVFIFPRAIDRPAGEDEEISAPASVTRAVDVVSFFWMPEATLFQRAKEDNIPYPEWRDRGFLTAMPGRLLDHDAMADFIIAEASRRGWRVRGIGIDQAGATAFVTRLQRHFGDELVTEVPQGFRTLSSPSKTLEALVLSGNLAHDGNPVMTMCVANMGKEENYWREIRPVKLNQRKRIDGGVAIIDALHIMERTPDEPAAAWESEGILILG